MVTTKPLSFETTKWSDSKSLVLFKSSVCINSSASGTVSDLTNTSQSYVALVQHSFANSKQVENLDSANSGDINLFSLDK